MSAVLPTVAVARRPMLRAILSGALGVVGTVIVARPGSASGEDDALIVRMLGRAATYSPAVHLAMPAVFANGYSVPMRLVVDSPMTEADHVRAAHVIAPKNPIVAVATFRFTPASGRAEVSTRIRLAQAQYVLAVAETSDGALLAARTWVKVETNGCE